uniref:Uncharacterized protein n=1 Tax=Setaria digitata TaxID=48799 RepID=A0A915PRA6_9BILA
MDHMKASADLRKDDRFLSDVPYKMASKSKPSSLRTVLKFPFNLNSVVDLVKPQTSLRQLSIQQRVPSFSESPLKRYPHKSDRARYRSIRH